MERNQGSENFCQGGGRNGSFLLISPGSPEKTVTQTRMSGTRRASWAAPTLALQPVLSAAASEPPGRAQVRAGTRCQLQPRQSSHSYGGQTPRPQRAPAEPLTVMTGRRRGCARPRTDLVQEDVGLHLHLPLPPQHVNLGGRMEGREGETRSRRESNGAHH